jgi:hypothetical protein
MSEQAMAEAIMGRDAADFIRSELGKVLLGRARIERDTALDTLKTVYPWRRRKIQELQNTIWRAESFEGWLAELIINGQNAERILDGQE